MEYSTLIARLKTASESFENLEVQLADPDIANDPKKLESIARERSKLEPLVNDFNKLLDTDKEIEDSKNLLKKNRNDKDCLLYTSPSPRDATLSRMPSSA